MDFDMDKTKIRAFMFYKRWADLFLNLPDDSKLELLDAILKYFFNGEEGDIEDPTLLAVFNMIKTQLDEDQDKYEEICKKRAEARKGKKNEEQNEDQMITIDNNCKQLITSEDSCQQKQPKEIKRNEMKLNNNINNNKKEKEKEKETPDKPKRFIPPSLDEIKTFCKERNSAVNPEKFYDYYESVGWKRGKNSIKNWKACLRSWEGRNSSQAPPKPNNSEILKDFFADITEEEDVNFD